MAEDSFPPGPGVDAAGRPVIDPTRNVLDLVNAAIQRQDDLRHAEAGHLREVIQIRVEQRKDELRAQRRIDCMRADHAKELRIAEAQRIDAIREVDNQAVRQAAEVQATQATTLANTVAASADAMRVAVVAATTAATQGLTSAIEPLQKDIADLRKAQYEAQGKQTNVVETRERGLSTTAWLLVGVGFIGLVLTIVSIIVVVAIATHGFTK